METETVQSEMASESKTLERKNGHYEIQDGDFHEFLPSVTTVLSQTVAKPGLISWAAKLGTEAMNRVRQESADWGSTLHKLIHEVVSGQAINTEQIDPAMAQCVHSFSEWMRLTNFKVLLSEHTVFSKTVKVAGTLDLLGTIYGRIVTLVDIKSFSGNGKEEAYREHFLQISAYAACVREMQLANPTLGIVLRLSKKDGLAYPSTVPDLEHGWEAFQQTKKVWEYLQER